MQVSVKNFMIIAAITILIVSSVLLLFFREVVNQSAGAPIQSHVSEAPQKAPEPVYSIPVNTVPGVDAIEENIKKNKQAADRAEIDKMSAKVAAEAAANRQEIRQQLEEAAAAPEGTEIADTDKKNAPAPQRSVFKPPTREEREAMKSRGVIAY